MISVTLFSLALLLARSANAATQLDLEAIQAHFTQALIVPALIPTFDPTAVLSAAFSGAEASTGQHMDQKAVGPKPVVTVSSVQDSSLSGNFTIAMVDADVVGTDYGADGVNRHWLENGVTISDGSVSDTSANVITAYAGPGPASGSGPHRYVILLYAQPSTFSAPADLSAPVDGVHKFDLNAYVKDSGLGALVAANYFTVEVGTDSTSLPVTSAVITSTLASAQSSAGPSGSHSGSASASAPAPSNPPNNAVAAKIEMTVAILAAGLSLALL
ncbi:nucleus protein [Favolaschia claudopus]|uniref:Nucleus protein n=1 Tax=Favolaschia claudopus TaxID=2862362 RepID=A0AAW0BC84_9AGAR